MCTSPLTAYENPSGGRPIFGYEGVKLGLRPLKLPCGNCDECKETYVFDNWGVRAHFELTQHKRSSFIALTYDNDHLPHNLSLNKKHLQDFLKRLRRRGHKVRYTYCGEYGDEKSRPHYHIVLYGYFPKDAKFRRYTEQGYPCFTSEFLRELWPFGIHEVGYATAASVAYLYKYAYKKIKRSDQKKGPRIIQFDGCEYEVSHEFIESSRNPGIGGYLRDTHQLKKGYLMVNGYRKSLPRYYMESLKKSDPDIFLRVSQQKMDYALKHKQTQRQLDERAANKRRIRQRKRD